MNKALILVVSLIALLTFAFGVGIGSTCAVTYEDGTCRSGRELEEINDELYSEVETLRENQKEVTRAIQDGRALRLCLVEQYANYTVVPCTVN